ncbi:MAG TPA: NAD(P)-dependent oxidoreductase, partial [Acidobacteriota bacterium]|nr:NAD(P)-dependent oxidoreductase [Acidobacteriota bacterium]
PYVSGGEIAAAGARRASIEEVFEIADVVSVHTPLLDETEKLIDGALLARMKHGATFINTSRGAIVDEPALIEFLRQRTDVDAVLDVTEPEPPLAASPLFDLPNVLITPHLAGCYGPECRRLGQFAVEEFQRHLAGQPLRGLVSREEALRTA